MRLKNHETNGASFHPLARGWWCSARFHKIPIGPAGTAIANLEKSLGITACGKVHVSCDIYVVTGILREIQDINDSAPSS
jgi:hypothetical protein